MWAEETGTPGDVGDAGWVGCSMESEGGGGWRGGLEAARSKYPGYPALLIWDKIFARIQQVHPSVSTFKAVLMVQADALAQAPEVAREIVDKVWGLSRIKPT